MARIHTNPYYLALLVIVAAASLYFCGKAAYKYYQYSALSAHVAGKVEKWQIEEISNEDYAIKAGYVFQIGGESYQGETTLSERYLNSWAAQQAIEGYKEGSGGALKVWYRPGDAHYSTLQKNFPLKECLSAFALIGLLIYFVFLGVYVIKFRT